MRSWLFISLTAFSLTACALSLNTPSTQTSAQLASNQPTAQNSAPPLNSTAPVESIQTIPDRMVVEISRKSQASATVRYADNTFDSHLLWSSSDNTLATVDANTGSITALKPGEVTIIATSVRDRSKRAGIQVSIKDVSTSAAIVSIEPQQIELSVAATATLTAKVMLTNASNSSNIRWSSSNSSVATVRGTGSVGTVIGVGKGTAEIVAVSEEDPTLNAKATVIVK